MKILLLGASGLLGSEFAKLLPGIDCPTHRDLDVTDEESVQSFFISRRYDLILYCVAYTAVDQAEIDRSLCYGLNVQGLRNILNSNIPIVHFSTDYVFDAPRGIEIPEDFPRHPLNYYGYTKLEAERLLEASGVPFWNIRTSWLFGEKKENFISKIIQKSKTQNTFSVVDDQIGRPTSSYDLAQFVCYHFLEKKLPIGHYHLQNQGSPVSWAELAEYIGQCIHWKGSIQKIPSDLLHGQTKRPKNSVLKNTKLLENLKDWKIPVCEYIKSF